MFFTTTFVEFLAPLFFWTNLFFAPAVIRAIPIAMVFLAFIPALLLGAAGLFDSAETMPKRLR